MKFKPGDHVTHFESLVSKKVRSCTIVDTYSAMHTPFYVIKNDGMHTPFYVIKNDGYNNERVISVSFLDRHGYLYDSLEAQFLRI